jgi:mannose-6-phosphate isomerase
MHARPAHAGDVWFVPPGTPHSIGAGAFILEIQEPTDFSIVAEVAGFPIDPADAHLGLGWDVAIDAIDRGGRDDAEIDLLRQPSTTIAEDEGLRRQSLLGGTTEPFFRAERVTVGRRGRPDWDATYVVGVVTVGSGVVRAPGGELAVRAGSTFALPAKAVVHVELESTGDGPLELIACLPPRAADLSSPPIEPEVP